MTRDPSVMASRRDTQRARHERAVALIDVEAVAIAVKGTTVTLTALERGVAITLAGAGGVDREIAARGIGVARETIDAAVTRQRRTVPPLRAEFLAVSMERPAVELVAAVRDWDPDAVADVLGRLDAGALGALAVVLAAMVEPGRGADELLAWTAGRPRSCRERVAA